MKYYEGVLSYKPTPEWTGGACHLNIDYPNKAFLSYLFLEISNNPWLIWGFNEPSDNLSATSLHQYGCNDDKYWQEILKNPYKDDFLDNKRYCLNIREKNKGFYDDSGRYIFKTYKRYLEMRFFKNVESYKELDQNINFTYALFEKIKEKMKSKKDRLIYQTRGDLYSISEKECKTKFIQYMSYLGLDEKLYRNRLKNIELRHYYHNLPENKIEEDFYLI